MFAIGLHEYSHCKFADMAGDPTPRYYGRLTLNPFRHLDPVGTLAIVLTTLTGLGIGWGKPAPMNASKMRNPRWDLFVAVAAGPISNLLQATVFAFCLRIALLQRFVGLVDIDHALRFESTDFAPALLVWGVMLNVTLFLFNLIPIGILDGHWLVGQLLPQRQQFYWYKYNRAYGSMVLLALVLFLPMMGLDVIGPVMRPPTLALFHILTGLKLSTHG